MAGKTVFLCGRFCRMGICLMQLSGRTAGPSLSSAGVGTHIGKLLLKPSCCSALLPAARNLLPAEQLRAAACNISADSTAGAPAAERSAPEPQQQAGDDQPPQRVAPEQLAAACGWDAAAGQLVGSSGNAIDQQHLFSAYVHAPPNLTGAGQGRLGWCGWVELG